MVAFARRRRNSSLTRADKRRLRVATIAARRRMGLPAVDRGPVPLAVALRELLTLRGIVPAETEAARR